LAASFPSSALEARTPAARRLRRDTLRPAAWMRMAAASAWASRPGRIVAMPVTAMDRPRFAVIQCGKGRCRVAGWGRTDAGTVFEAGRVVVWLVTKLVTVRSER
jgi:hypothetical protein